MVNSSLCDSNKALGREVSDFILNVPDVKEESITDYLVWKWCLLDKRFKYIRPTTFSRQTCGHSEWEKPQNPNKLVVAATCEVAKT